MRFDPTEAAATDDFVALGWLADTATGYAKKDSVSATVETWLLPATVTIHSLYVKVSSPPGVAADDWRVSALIDGIGTTVTCDVSETATWCRDSTHVPPLTWGGALSIRVHSDPQGGGVPDPTVTSLMTVSLCTGEP